MLKGWINLIYFLTNVLFKAKFGSTARTSMLAEEIQRDAEMSDRNYVFSCTGNCIPTFVVGGCIFRCVFVSGRNYGCLHQIFLQLWLQFAKLSVQVTLHHCSGILSLTWTIVGFLPTHPPFPGQDPYISLYQSLVRKVLWHKMTMIITVKITIVWYWWWCQGFTIFYGILLGH